MVRVRKDMTGWKMSEHGVPDSRLTVIRQDEDYVAPNGKCEAQWLCECSCEKHNTIVSTGSNIRNGHTKSCGCLRVDANKANFKKYNKYDLSGEYGIIWSTNTNEEIYFDLCDAEEILKYCWSIDSTGYPSTSIDRHNVRMHVFLGCKGYDHANKNKLDNRKKNLRPASRQDNRRNSSKRINNKSGFIGVYFDEKINKWVAQITINYQTKALGCFANKEDAIKVRLKTEKELFGNFAPQQDLFEQYKIGD